MELSVLNNCSLFVLFFKKRRYKRGQGQIYDYRMKLIKTVTNPFGKLPVRTHYALRTKS
jgi:hypothetical protein